MRSRFDKCGKMLRASEKIYVVKKKFNVYIGDNVLLYKGVKNTSILV